MLPDACSVVDAVRVAGRGQGSWFGCGGTDPGLGCPGVSNRPLKNHGSRSFKPFRQPSTLGRPHAVPLNHPLFPSAARSFVPTLPPSLSLPPSLLLLSLPPSPSVLSPDSFAAWIHDAQKRKHEVRSPLRHGGHRRRGIPHYGETPYHLVQVRHRLQGLVRIHVCQRAV